MRLSISPDTQLTLQDHLETFFLIVYYFTIKKYSLREPPGAGHVIKTLRYIRENYLEGRSTAVMTRGLDGIAALIEQEADFKFEVINENRLTYVVKETLLGIWAWYSFHQVISTESVKAVIPGEEGLFLYNHIGMLTVLEEALNNIE